MTAGTLTVHNAPQQSASTATRSAAGKDLWTRARCASMLISSLGPSAASSKLSGPDAGGGMRQQLQAVLFEDRAARASRVHGDVADAAVLGFLDPGRKKGGVEPATPELRDGGTAPQAGEGTGSGEPDPAAGRWGFVDVRDVDRD